MPSMEVTVKVERRLARWLSLGQGAGYIATGAWPLVSMRTFESVTGPKRDHWLVRTVGALAIVIGIGLLARRDRPLAVRPIAVGGALVFGGIDVIGVASGRIRRVYLLDAAAQSAILLGWAVEALARRRRTRPIH